MLGGRVSIGYDEKEGHYDNVANPGQALGDESNFTVNGGLDFTPNEQLTVKLNAGYYRSEDGIAAVSRVGGFAEHNFGGFPLAGGGTTETAFRGNIRTPDASEIGASTTDAQYRATIDAALNDPRGFTFLGLEFDDLPDNGGLVQEGTRLSADLTYDFSDNLTLDLLAGYNEKRISVLCRFRLNPRLWL